MRHLSINNKTYCFIHAVSYIICYPVMYIKCTFRVFIL